MDEELAFLSLIASRLDVAGIAYMVTGSLAMAIYSVPRMTRDIDVVIDCQSDQAMNLASLFEVDCYVEGETVREEVARRGMFNIIHNESVIKADFIVRKDEPYRQVEFERRRKVTILGQPIWVVAPEDLILSKLYWARDSGSELQQRDARLLAGSVEELDWSYLERWAGSLGIWSLLAEVRPS